MHFGFRDPRRNQIAPTVSRVFYTSVPVKAQRLFQAHEVLCTEYTVYVPFHATHSTRYAALLSAMPQHTCFLPLPISVLLGCAFIVQFLALGQTDFQFGSTFLPIQ